MISSLFVLAAAFFGLKFDPAATNAVTESRIYPVAPAAYRMVQPDGTARMFNLTDAEKGILAGPSINAADGSLRNPKDSIDLLVNLTHLLYHKSVVFVNDIYKFFYYFFIFVQKGSWQSLKKVV